MKYNCTYISGGGTEYDGGIWEKKETPKTITFICVKKSFYAVDWDKLVIHKNPKKNKRHCLRDWQDGTYTIYPDQCGTPHIFEPIPSTLNQEEKMPKVKLNFEQGLAFALGELIRGYDEPSIATDILRSSGITYEQLKEAEVSEYDLKVIKKALSL